MQFAKFMIAAIMIGCLSFYILRTTFAQAQVTKASPVQEVGTDPKVVLDLPQRTFLVGEPIHLFVGVQNDTDSLVVIPNINNKLFLKITTPSGKFALPSYIACGGSSTSIGPHETLWVHLDLIEYSNLNLRGKYTITASVGRHESEVVEITLVEPIGQDKSVLDWIRSKVATDVERIESKTGRARRATMLSQTAIAERRTLAQIFRDSVLGQHAEYYITQGSYSNALDKIKLDTKELESVLRRYRSIAEQMPDTPLATLARIGEMRCLSLLGQPVEPSTELMRSGFARQEVDAIMSPATVAEK